MALIASVTLDRLSYSGGDTPLKCTLTVYNPNASAIVVTAAVLRVEDWNNPRNRIPCNIPLIPYSAGQSSLIPALGTLSFGPFNIAAVQPGSMNAYIDPPPTNMLGLGFGNAVQPDNAFPGSVQCRVGCVVYASDRSATEASPAGFLLNYTNPPPPTYQGGWATFSNGNNAGNFIFSFA